MLCHRGTEIRDSIKFLYLNSPNISSIIKVNDKDI